MSKLPRHRNHDIYIQRQKEKKIIASALGMCRKCCDDLPIPGKVTCQSCTDYMTERNNKLTEAGKCYKHKDSPIVPGYTLCQKCIDSSRNFRSEVVREYGGFCQCCGETNPAFLTIDHVFGGGTKERREQGNASHQLYARMKREGYPKDKYRLLCYNCNCGRRNGPCPHTLENSLIA